MSGKDDDLLARLNALKPSTVSFENDAPAIDVEIAKALSIEDKLAERLKGLRSGSGRDVGSHLENFREQTASVACEAGDEPAGLPDHDKNDWLHHGQDEPSVEDLLAELGPEDQWKLDPDDPKNIDSLLKEATAALPSEPDAQAQDQDEQPSVSRDYADQDADATNSTKRSGDQQDEDEAADYVRRVLAELEMDQKYGNENAEGEEDEEESANDENVNSSALDFPSTPSNMPQPPSKTEPPSYEDSEIEARFSKLGLDLPSTPNITPSSKARAISKTGVEGLKKAQAKSSLPTYTDEDIDSWCCICNEDGEVRCLGCDGDIYCQNCWSEGHGNGPGQERGHRAVQYNKNPPTVAAAA